MKDFFRDMPDLPKEIYIVATGPSVNNTRHIIPDNAPVMAVNGAVVMPGLNPKWMAAFDPRIVNTEWWSELQQNPSGKDIIKIYSNNILTEDCHDGDADYTFNSRPHIIKPNRHPLIPNVLRGGATVTGVAVQACYYKNCRVIHVLGADFSSNLYYNNTINPQIKSDGRWPMKLSIFNCLVDYMKKQGVQVIRYT